MQILEDVDTAYGRIQIIEDKLDKTITYVQDGILQSQCDQEGVTTCGYIVAMAQLLVQARPKNILIIGGAGGCLASLMYKAGYNVTLVDINQYAFDLAKRYFKLPEQITCISADGKDYVSETNETFDAIAIDAFNGKGQIPKSLTTQVFFRFLGEALNEKGLAIMNIMTAHDLDMEADRIAAKATAMKREMIIFDRIGRKERNTLLCLGNVAQLEAPIPHGRTITKEEMRGFSRRLARA